MQPFRSLYPHAGLLLPHTADVAARVIVLPTGPTLPVDAIDTVADVVRALREGAP
jgi:dTDP-4-amino-4,6-dideoxygalactose transaminase